VVEDPKRNNVESTPEQKTRSRIGLRSRARKVGSWRHSIQSITLTATSEITMLVGPNS
jgi:hypothetical protein